MTKSINPEENEIDLLELFGAIWSHKFLIVLFTALSILLSGHYALTTEKRFTARAIFKIEEISSGSSFNISDELGALASLAGFGGVGKTSSSEVLLERAIGREFILNMKEKYSLELDPFFNNYNPNYKDPVWKMTIKKIIGWQKTEREKNAIVENKIIGQYRKNVGFEITDSDAISISVTHVDPKKASDFANSLMEEMRQLVQNESDSAQELRLNYLSKTLADALQEMEETQENLKNYALKNSAMAQENFITDSLKLDQIRMEKRKVAEIAELLNILGNLVELGKVDRASYEELRSNHPLVDDVDFRRILGMSETISAWTWPEINTIDAVSATLRDRMKRLDVEIKNSEDNAKIYALSAEGLAQLTREAKIAEATYTVLVEQVKSQTLAAGFQPETFKVFEYATPPLTPSSPKRTLILALGSVLGLFVGSTLGLINAKRRGVYYSISSLISEASAELALRSKTIRRVSRKSISDINSFIAKNRIIALDEAALKLSNKKIIYVLNFRGKLNTTRVASLLASRSAQSGRNVLLCDITEQAKKENKTDNRSDLSIENLSNNMSVMTAADGSSFFSSNDFGSKVKDLTKRFDQVFVCTSNSNAQLGLIALLEFNPGLVTITSLQRTRKLDIKNLIKRQPIDILFYD